MAAEAEELATINPRVARDQRRDEMYFAWRTARLAQNAGIKRQNEITKTSIDLHVVGGPTGNSDVRGKLVTDSIH